MEHASDLGGGVVGIDTLMGGYQGITASYLIGSAAPCLVETGTARSAPQVVRALRDAGLGPQDLAWIVVTHIHLDHAGGVGDLAEAFPSARVVVHESGARHLADPRRLLASAATVFGPDLDQLFGPLRPVPVERLYPIADHGTLELGDGRQLDAHHAPGHARHHLGLLDSATGDLYVGDAAGVFVPETAQIRPATPPPDFDLRLALDTLAGFAERRPSRLLFSHFGPVHAVEEVLAESAAELRRWVDIVSQARADGLDLDHAVRRLLERTAERYAPFLDDPLVAQKFERLSPTPGNVAGILAWLDRQAQAAGG